MLERSDEELVEALLDRDEDALRVVVDRFEAIVYGMARRVVADPHLAEEIAQDTFLALWRRPGAFDRTRGTLQAFLLGIARNKAIDLVRKEQSLRRSRSDLHSQAEAAASTGVSGNEPLEEVENREEIRRALAQLSEGQREALTLAYFGGRTYREVAAEVGIPEGTAKTRLRDGLLKLRKLLGSYRSS